MRDIINLCSAPIDLTSDAGHQFVVDATRAAEGLITDKELAEKYELSPEDWSTITKDQALGRAIRAERERRVLSGTAAIEAAKKYFVKTPSVLDQIMSSEQSNNRHRIEAIRELRATTAIGDDGERPTASEMFSIRIDLTAGGGDVEVFNKTIQDDRRAYGHHGRCP